MQSKAPTSLGLVVDKQDMNQITTSKMSKRSQPEAPKKTGFGFLDLGDAVQAQGAPPSEQVLTIKKRGRPRKEKEEEPVVIDSAKAKKDKVGGPSAKKLKKSNSVGFEVAVNEDTFQSLFIDSKEES